MTFGLHNINYVNMKVTGLNLTTSTEFVLEFEPAGG